MSRQKRDLGSPRTESNLQLNPIHFPLPTCEGREKAKAESALQAAKDRSRFSSRLTVPRSDGNRTFAREPGHTPLALAFLRDREGLSLRRRNRFRSLLRRGNSRREDARTRHGSGTRADGCGHGNMQNQRHAVKAYDPES